MLPTNLAPIKSFHSLDSTDVAVKELSSLDMEGRCVITDHGTFVLFNLYIPNAHPRCPDPQNDTSLSFEAKTCSSSNSQSKSTYSRSTVPRTNEAEEAAEERFRFKCRYLEALQSRWNDYLEKGRRVLVVGMCGTL